MIQSIYFVLLLVFSLSYQSVPSDYDFIYFDGIHSLSELPMKKLLQIKSTYTPRFGLNNESFKFDNIQSRTFAEDYDFTHSGKNYPIKRFEEWEENKWKNSKISKIFNLTISALSFLAFGGYLITLIVTAINNKNIASNSTSGNIIYLSNLKKKRPKRQMFNGDQMFHYNSEKLYKGMILLSQDFAKLN